MIGSDRPDPEATPDLGPDSEGDRDKGPGRFAAHFTYLAPGVPAPEDLFQDGQGRAVALADFQGSWVLVNLWATWCGPCVAEMPSLDTLQQELGDEGLVVVALNTDRGGLELIRRFYGQHRLTGLEIYWDDTGNLMWRFEAEGLPSSYLVTPQGEILASVLGAAAWDSQDALDFFRYYLAE